MIEDQPLPRLPLSGEELKACHSPSPDAPPDKSTGESGRVEEELRACSSPSLDKGRAGEGFEATSAFLPYNRNLSRLARENRNNPTKAESKIWNEVLRMRQFAKYKFLRQKPIANYIVDFYCSELRLVIEIDGDSHAEAVAYDAERTKVLQSLGLTVIRYTNHDILQNIQGVFDDLSAKIEKRSNPTPPPPPLIRGGA